LSRLQLLIESDLDDVCLVAAAINGICLYLGLDKIQASNVELCVVEAVTNAIKHAYQGEPGQTVSVVVSPHIQRLDIEVCDNGRPMPPMAIARLQQGTSKLDVKEVDESLLAESGRGLQIIHDVMDTVVYKRENDQNRLSFTKRIYPTSDS
jgi:serine/threonine-protein kinase RsbW